MKRRTFVKLAGVMMVVPLIDMRGERVKGFHAVDYSTTLLNGQEHPHATMTVDGGESFEYFDRYVRAYRSDGYTVTYLPLS